MIAQSRSEIERRFGKNEALTITDNAVVQIWYGISSLSESKMVSDMMGEEHALATSLGRNDDLKLNTNISWLKGHHDALISVETFEKVQARLQGITRAPQRKNIGNDFALRGFVCCSDCGVPLRSSYSTGRSRSYAYYLCQTKTCDSYGKSIARDKLESDVGALVKTLQPSKQLFALAKAMFRHAWDQRLSQAQDTVRSGQSQVKAIEKQIETLLTRIMGSTNTTVIGTYEDKITELERSKIILGEQLANQANPKGTYEEKLEPVLTFLANPCKLWETGHVALRRTVLKLAFADRIIYDRNQGARTPEITLPFKVLDEFTNHRVCFGAPTRTPIQIIANGIIRFLLNFSRYYSSIRLERSIFY